MSEWLHPIYADGLGTMGLFLGIFLLFLLGWLPIGGGILYLGYLVLTIPLRRNERSRLLLDLLELGLRDGQTPEEAILEATQSGDPALGTDIHGLSGQLQSGLRLGAALNEAPRALPAQICKMLQAGERVGDLKKVLPACRTLLQDSISQVRGASNYLILLAFCITPATIAIPVLIGVKVLPQFREVFNGMGVKSLPAFSSAVFAQSGWFVRIEAALLLFLWLLVMAYVGGPRLRAWLGRIFPGWPDALVMALPWRRKRLQRDFSAMLAVLLDASMPEAEAVTAAAEATANRQIMRRGDKVRGALASGVKLTEALQFMDNSGELRWRIANALQAQRGFVRALQGWHETLDARSFQLEQTAAQIATTVLVLANGLLVAAIFAGVFLMLINLINEAALW